MLDDHECKLLLAAERIAFYESIEHRVQRLLDRARADYQNLLKPDPGTVPACQLTTMSAWFSPSDTAAFVTSADVVEIVDMHGWTNGAACMRQIGFRAMMFYLDGKKVRGWVRGPTVVPRNVEKLPRYRLRRVQVGQWDLAISAPPLPY